MHADVVGSMVRAEEPRLRQDFAVFEALVRMAEDFFNASRPHEAVACAEIAAACAWRNHCGVFASPRLERLLSHLGMAGVARPGTSRPRIRPRSPAHILHVMSKARPMGGDSRFACRWVQADSDRRHSVAITTQLDEPVPDEFLAAATKTGGSVHRLDADTRDPFARARRLRVLAEQVDLIALHLYPDDVVPVLAFARKVGLPPVVFVNHSDHTFWLGGSAANLVVQLRESSVPLTLRRRHIESGRLAFLPIPLPAAERTLSRAEAKTRLGLSPDSVVLLSVGTAFKYVPVAGPGFLDVLLPVITKHSEAVLLTVGPRNSGEWAAAHRTTGGRIVALGRRYDISELCQAADVYLDSFPCTSPTAALEAGSHGLPLVAYSTHTGDADVFSPGAPGLDDSIFRFGDVDAYTTAISRLIEDAGLRREWGDLALACIDHHHQGGNWRAHLEGLYRQTGEPPPPGAFTGSDRFEADVVDMLVSRLYRIDGNGLGHIIDEHVCALPLTGRVAVLRNMLRVNRSFSLDLFLPRWLARRLTVRPPYWGAIRRWMSRQGSQVTATAITTQRSSG